VVISHRQKNSVIKIIKCDSDYKKHYIVWVQEHFLRQLFIYLFITIYIGSDLWEKYKDKIHLYIKYPPRAKEKKGDNYNSLPSLFFSLSLFSENLFIWLKKRCNQKHKLALIYIKSRRVEKLEIKVQLEGIVKP